MQSLLMVLLGTSLLFAESGLSGKDPIRTFLKRGTDLKVPREKILSGGPAIDGIPAISNPDLVRVTAAPRFLFDSDLVLGVEMEGQARAYPIKILNWHEAVNDQIGDTPFVVTYCPLCGSGIAFKRKVKNRTLTFGVSGLLYNSAMVLYDWETRSLWSQIMAESIAGDLAGTPLETIPVHYAEWKNWKALHPKTLVMSDKTGHLRSYNRDPYAGYAKSERLYFPVEHENRRLGKKELVYGVHIEKKQKAYRLRALKKLKKIEDKIGGKSFTIEWNKGVPKASYSNGEKIPGSVMFWFAWSSFYPKTTLYEE